MDHSECLELDQRILRIEVDNPLSWGCSLARNKICGIIEQNWDKVRKNVETCMLEGCFTPENFPLLNDYLAGKNVRVKGNRFVLHLLDEASKHSEKELLSDGKNHLTMSIAKSENGKPLMRTFRIQKIGEKSVTFTFDTEVTLMDVPTENFEMDELYLGVNATCSRYNREAVLKNLLAFGGDVKYRREDRGVVVYKELWGWDECIAMVGSHAEKECRGGLARGFLYLSEFMMEWKFKDELEELQRLSKTPYVMANTGVSLLSKNLGDFNLVTLQEEVRRTDTLLRGLKSVENVMVSFIERLKKNNPDRVDLRVGFGKNWREILGLITVTKIAQDPGTYAEDRRPYIAMVARLILDGTLDPSELPVV